MCFSSTAIICIVVSFFCFITLPTSTTQTVPCTVYANIVSRAQYKFFVFLFWWNEKKKIPTFCIFSNMSLSCSDLTKETELTVLGSHWNIPEHWSKTLGISALSGLCYFDRSMDEIKTTEHNSFYFCDPAFNSKTHVSAQPVSQSSERNSNLEHETSTHLQTK